MIQDFIREHNELYSDPKQVRRLKVLPSRFLMQFAYVFG